MRKSLTMLAVAAMAVLLVQGCGEDQGPTVDVAKSVAAEAPKAVEKAPAEAANAAGAPVNELKSDGIVAKWDVLVFTVTTESERGRDQDYFMETFKKDYLAPLGGQATAAIGPDTTVAYKNAAGEEQTAKAEAMEANSIGVLGSEWSEDLLGRKVVYAYCLLKSDKDQEVTCYFGSDDEAVVYVNGQEVISNEFPRSFESRQNDQTVKLNKGLNPVMVKASQRSQSWVFSLEVYPQQ